MVGRGRPGSRGRRDRHAVQPDGLHTFPASLAPVGPVRIGVGWPRRAVSGAGERVRPRLPSCGQSGIARQRRHGQVDAWPGRPAPRSRSSQHASRLLRLIRVRSG